MPMMKYISFIFFITSCAFFRPEASLKTKDKEFLLNAVRLTGEGRGRLTLNQRQYVFNVDSVLNEDYDWILAVSIPLQGEEVMILPDLRQKEIHDHETESFEKRIGIEFRRLKLDRLIGSEEFLNELRSIIRFNLSTSWGQKRYCLTKGENLICEIDKERFNIDVSDKELTVNKTLRKGMILQLVAKNLTESFFRQTEIRLYSNEKDLQARKSSFALELFW